nr:ATP synthase F0 subunit 8 [Micraspides sp.]
MAPLMWFFLFLFFIFSFLIMLMMLYFYTNISTKPDLNSLTLTTNMAWKW